MKHMKLKKDMGVCLLSCLTTALFPIAFLYFNNVKEVNFTTSLRPVLFSLIVFGCIFISVFIFTKSLMESAGIACFIYLIFANYSLIETGIALFFPKVKYWQLLPIVIVATIHAVSIANKKISKEWWKEITFVFGLIFGVMILLNIIMSVPSIIEKLGSERNSSSVGKSEETLVKPNDDLYPNIYYLLFDEYSNFTVLERYYQYDNDVLKKFLKENNFHISLGSRNNSLSTHVITTNNLNLEYVATSITDYSPYRENPKLFTLLDQYGYDISYLSALPIGWENTQKILSETTTVDGKSFWDIFIGRTALSHFLISDNTNELVKDFYNAFDFVNRTIGLQDHNQFVYVHFPFPHMPFVFDKDGNYVGMENRNNTADNKYYLEQLMYTTQYMIDSVTQILDKDPEAIVILQSDHSNRYIGKPLGQGSLGGYEDATNIFNAVYFRGEDISEIDNLSSVNTLRTVLNRALNCNLEMVEEVPLDG